MQFLAACHRRKGNIAVPAEFRFLVFSPTEAASALEAHARRHAKAVPDGKVISAEPVGETTINGRLLVDTGVAPPTIVPFSTNEILEALIEDCLARSIPLPRVSEKVLERLHGRFAIRIGQIDSIEMMMRNHAPRRSR